jgi:hypothetical protein
MALAPTPENFRAEIARHLLSRRVICQVIGMNPNLFSQFVSGTKPLQGWAAHNIGIGINAVTGLKLIDVDMARGVVEPPPSGRRAGWNRPSAVDPSLRWPRRKGQAS